MNKFFEDVPLETRQQLAGLPRDSMGLLMVGDRAGCLLRAYCMLVDPGGWGQGDRRFCDYDEPIAVKHGIPCPNTYPKRPTSVENVLPKNVYVQEIQQLRPLVMMFDLSLRSGFPEFNIAEALGVQDAN